MNRVWTEPERRRVQCNALQMVVCYRSESGSLAAAAAATSRGDSRYGKLQNSEENGFLFGGRLKGVSE